jgi:hypothetical protein
VQQKAGGAHVRLALQCSLPAHTALAQNVSGGRDSR